MWKKIKLLIDKHLYFNTGEWFLIIVLLVTTVNSFRAVKELQTIGNLINNELEEKENGKKAKK